MLPYNIYLLTFVLCIELTISNGYLNSHDRNIRRNGKYTVGKRRLQRGRERRTPIHDYDYDRNRIEFDLANFIQGDDDQADAEQGYGHDNRKRKRIVYDYDYGALTDFENGNNKRDKTPDYLNVGDNAPELNLNSPLFKDNVDPKHMNNPLSHFNMANTVPQKSKNFNDIMMDANLDDKIHNKEKKCALKTLRFPFFSRKKSKESQPVAKKENKRKLFSFKSSKNYRNQQPKTNIEIKNQDLISQLKTKRSYVERLCPACKKKFIANLSQTKRQKKHPKKTAQNTREFYENLPDEQLQEDSMMTVRKKNNDDIEFSRRKRESDRERQLKELEEVQRRIDNIELRMPVFPKITKPES